MLDFTPVKARSAESLLREMIQGLREQAEIERHRTQDGADPAFADRLEKDAVELSKQLRTRPTQRKNG